MDPSALSARDLARDMYDFVLCHEPNPALSRIWIHLVRLEGIDGYATNQILRFCVSGHIFRAWRETGSHFLAADR